MIRAAMRPELPTGTVTFLFTDVEGSTKLLHELGAEAYAEVLAEHRRVIREACAAEGGVEVDTQGDAFFFAFPTAPGALDAASAFTRDARLRPDQVRVGLHTGTPLLADEGYVGDDVHFAARVASSGHGGQVVLSKATAAARRGRAREPGRASAEGHPRGGIDLPARRRQLSSPQDDLEHEPAAPSELVRRKSRRTSRCDIAHRARRASRHAYGAWRYRQDPSRPRSGAHARPRVQGRRLLGWARVLARPRTCRGDDRADPRCQGRTRRAHCGEGDAPPPRQPRAGDRCRFVIVRAPADMPQPQLARDEPRAHACARRGRVPRPSPGRPRSRRSLLRALRARAFARRSPSCALASTRSRLPSSLRLRERRRSLLLRSSSGSPDVSTS